MPADNLRFITACLIFAALLPARAAADKIHVAVASNFATTLQIVAKRFEEQTQHRVILITGSTGKHYAQIQNGAPYDAFFAADSHRVEQLEKSLYGVSGSRFTYAIGKLIAWSPDTSAPVPDAKQIESGNFNHIAIANPKLAPYGRAAKQVLQTLGLWQQLQGRLVRGENIGQTFQFVKSGNAPIGFIAYSQVKRPGKEISGSWWNIPEKLYEPILQQAILLSEESAAQDFIRYCRSDEALKIIRDYGYHTPDADI